MSHVVAPPNACQVNNVSSVCRPQACSWEPSCTLQAGAANKGRQFVPSRGHSQKSWGQRQDAQGGYSWQCSSAQQTPSRTGCESTKEVQAGRPALFSCVRRLFSTQAANWQTCQHQLVHFGLFQEQKPRESMLALLPLCWNPWHVCTQAYTLHASWTCSLWLAACVKPPCAAFCSASLPCPGR